MKHFDRKIKPFLEQIRIKFRHPCIYTYQQNGRVERKHKHIVGMGLTLLAQATMPLSFLWEAFSTTTFLINHLPTPTFAYLSPIEALFHQKLDFLFLKTFGCTCYPHLRPYNNNKPQFRSSECVFLGYSTYHKGYKCLHPSRRIYIACSVCFDENDFHFIWFSMFQLTSRLPFH